MPEPRAPGRAGAGARDTTDETSPAREKPQCFKDFKKKKSLSLSCPPGRCLSWFSLAQSRWPVLAGGWATASESGGSVGDRQGSTRPRRWIKSSVLGKPVTRPSSSTSSTFASHQRVMASASIALLPGERGRTLQAQSHAMPPSRKCRNEPRSKRSKSKNCRSTDRYHPCTTFFACLTSIPQLQHRSSHCVALPSGCRLILTVQMADCKFQHQRHAKHLYIRDTRPRLQTYEASIAFGTDHTKVEDTRVCSVVDGRGANQRVGRTATSSCRRQQSSPCANAERLLRPR